MVNIVFRQPFIIAAAAIGAGALLFILPALLNGFPFLFDDSADYLIFKPRLYRSPYYGLFIFFFHLDTFIWAVVIAQAIIIAHLLWVFVRLFRSARRVEVFLGAAAVLALFSSLPFMAGFIMADMFTAVMILTLYILAFHHDRLSRLETVYFFLLTCVGVAAHISHIPIALSVIALALGILWRQGAGAARLRMAGALIVAPVMLAGAANLLNNGVIHRVASLSPAGPVFFMANLIEQGPARRYLAQACPAAGYKICAQLEGMPSTSVEILWSTDFLARLGGVEGMREEAAKIVSGTLRNRPGDTLQATGAAILGALQARAPGAELGPLGNAFWMDDVLLKKFGPATLEAWRASAQNQARLPRALLKRIDEIVFPLSLLALLTLCIVSLRSRLDRSFAFSAVILTGVAANIVLCAAASGVFDRYQARVSWLLPFGVLLIGARLMEKAPANAAERVEIRMT